MKIKNNKLIGKLFTLAKLLIVLVLLSNIVFSAELEVFVNSYEADKKKAFIQIQNSGEKDLHDVQLTINSLPTQKLVELLPSKASNIIMRVLSAGEHTIKVETKEGVSVEQKIVLGRTEQQIAKEGNAQDKNAPLTASQIEENEQAQEEIKSAQIDPDAQLAALMAVKQDNSIALEDELKKADDRQQKLFDAETQEREALRQKSLEAKLAAEKKPVPDQQAYDQRKEFPATKEKSNLALNISIGVLVIIGIVFLYYMFKKNE